MTDSEIERLAEEADDAVSKMCAPDKMSKRDALQFLECLASRIDSSIGALHDELREDDE